MEVCTFVVCHFGGDVLCCWRREVQCCGSGEFMQERRVCGDAVSGALLIQG